jgi:hypothetical protein
VSKLDARSLASGLSNLRASLFSAITHHSVRANERLLGLAWLQKIQRHPHRLFRCYRAHPRHRRRLRRHGLLRQPPHPRIGVRVALGAGHRQILNMVLAQGLRTIFIGVAIGIAAALALTRTVASLLFGVTPTDPLTFAAVTIVLIVAALAACYLPARRAHPGRPPNRPPLRLNVPLDATGDPRFVHPLSVFLFAA